MKKRMSAADRLRTLLFALCGAIAALPVCFTQFSLLSFFSFIPLLCLLFSELLSERPRFSCAHYYGVGLLVLMPYFIAVFHWFVYLWPLDFVGGMTPLTAAAIILLACFGLPLLQSLTFALLFPLLARLAHTRTVRRAPILLPFLFAALWVVFAYTQTLTWAGVPWGAQLALALQEVPFFLQSASLFGSYFVTFCIAAINACLAFALLMTKRCQKRGARIGALLACLILLLDCTLSGATYLRPHTEESKLQAAVLQGNIGSSEKWSGEVNPLAIYGTLAREAAAEGATLIIWPETALPTYLMSGTNLAQVKAIAAETDAIQIIGAYAYQYTESGTFLRYNSLFLVYPDGRVSESVYKKRHLVPFGEYLPMAELIRTLLPMLADLEMMQDGSDVTPGVGPALFDEPFGCIGGLICFDSIYPDLCRESVAAGAELIALGTNDSWFFDSAAVYMHNGQAVLRAIESGRYVLRAANTGISSIIDEHGNTLVEIPPLVSGAASAEVSLLSERTLYSYIGDLFVLLCLLFVCVPPSISLFTRFRRALDKRKDPRYN